MRAGVRCLGSGQLRASLLADRCQARAAPFRCFASRKARNSWPVSRPVVKNFHCNRGVSFAPWAFGGRLFAGACSDWLLVWGPDRVIPRSRKLSCSGLLFRIWWPIFSLIFSSPSRREKEALPPEGVLSELQKLRPVCGQKGLSRGGSGQTPHTSRAGIGGYFPNLFGVPLWGPRISFWPRNPPQTVQPAFK